MKSSTFKFQNNPLETIICHCLICNVLCHSSNNFRNFFVDIMKVTPVNAPCMSFSAELNTFK